MHKKNCIFFLSSLFKSDFMLGMPRFKGHKKFAKTYKILSLIIIIIIYPC